MTAPQAIHAQAVLESPKTVQPLTAIDGPAAVPRLPAVREAIGRLYAPEATTYSATETQALVDSLFEVLEAVGLTHLIPQLIADLSQKGLYALAAALQEKMQGQSGEQEPPITT
jgi:hypothetical protein